MNPIDKIKESFEFSLNYHQQLEDTIADYQFEDINDEIEYYKTIKPVFTKYVFLFNKLNRMHVKSQSTTIKKYTKYLKELHQFGYLVYEPSFNPNVGSTVNLFTFDNSTNKGSGKGSDKSSAMVVRPSINYINNINNINSNKRRNVPFHPPTRDEVKAFFHGNAEGDKFFDHFESNGWLVGGKTKMKNWKAAAKNWITRSSNFTKANPLSSNTMKNYSEPL